MEKKVNKEIHGDAYFNLINNEGEFLNYVKEKIQYLEDNIASLSNYEIESYVTRIVYDFCTFGYSFDLTKLPVLWFVEKYEKYLTRMGKLGILFEINNYELAEEYIQKNYEELKEEFQKTFIAFSHFDRFSEFGTTDIEYKITALCLYGEEETKDRGLFIVPQSYKANPLTYLLFKYFRNDIIFLYPEGEGDYLLGFYFDFTWKYYKKMLVDLEREGDYDCLNKLIHHIIYNQKVFSKYDDVEDYFQDFSYVEQIFRILRFNGKKSRTDRHYLKLSEVFKNDEEYVLKNTNASKERATKVLSTTFFANINYLKSLPKSEWENDEVYQEDIKLFNEFFQEYFNYLTKATPQIIRRIFNRIILGEYLFDILKINSDTSLLHYYKTGEIIFFQENDLKEDIIFKTNTREYYDIKRICQKSISEKKIETFSDNLEGRQTVCAYKILSFFGYNRAKRILSSSLGFSITEQLANIKFKDKNAKEKFVDLLFNDLSLVEKIIKSGKDVESFFIIFENLYLNDFKLLTLPQIAKRVANFECYLTPNTQKIIDNLLLLNQVNKGEPLANKVNAIKLYDEYRMRTQSSIPDIKESMNNLEYSMVDMHSPEIISNGIGKYMYPNNSLASSCLTPAGKASSCLEHGAINENGRFFKITINGRILAYSWVWRAGDIICFDNIEVTEESKAIPNFSSLIINIYKAASEKIIKISEMYEPKPIKAAIVGCNPIDILTNELEALPPVKSFVKENFKPNQSENLYLTDSKDNQYLLTGTLDESIETEDRECVYHYQRPAIKEFKDIPYKKLKEELNSIYFDYCLYTGISYNSINLDYEYGYLGEDWFIGYRNDGTYDVYYAHPSEESLKEMQRFVDLNNVIVKPKVYIAKDYSEIDYYLSETSYDINHDAVKEYLESLKEIFNEYSQFGYFHGTDGDIKAIGQILLDNAITSSAFGNHRGGGGSNGSHFICVAEIGSSAYETYNRNEGFIISPNICAFKTGIIPLSTSMTDLIKSRCIIRPTGVAGERQVLDYISLDSIDCITINPENIENMAKILYLQEYAKRDIPLVTNQTFKKIDKSELKRLIKLK